MENMDSALLNWKEHCKGATCSMKWEKLGKIFDPTLVKLPMDCFAYAQSPQTLLFDNCVRIYFSTRQRDGDKFLSQIAYIEMDKNLKEIKKNIRPAHYWVGKSWMLR